MALKLYASTPEQDEYQREGFGVVLMTVSAICIVLSLASIVAGTPCIRERLDQKIKAFKRTKVLPRATSGGNPARAQVGSMARIHRENMDQ